MICWRYLIEVVYHKMKQKRLTTTVVTPIVTHVHVGNEKEGIMCVFVLFVLLYPPLSFLDALRARASLHLCITHRHDAAPRDHGFAVNVVDGHPP